MIIVKNDNNLHPKLKMRIIFKDVLCVDLGSIFQNILMLEDTFEININKILRKSIKCSILKPHIEKSQNVKKKKMMMNN